MNEIIANEKDINHEVFWNRLKYQDPLFLAKYLITATEAKNGQLVNNANDGLIDFKKAINRKEILENENSKKIVNIVEKILDFKKTTKR